MDTASSFSPPLPAARYTEWSLLVDACRPNALVTGTEGAPETFLRSMDLLLRRPVFHWPADGCPWTAERAIGTLVLHDVGSLDTDDQARLARWLENAGLHLQVISLASLDLYPLVQRGLFLELLYYRLNTVYVPIVRAADRGCATAVPMTM
jgi:hypothetical protein